MYHIELRQFPHNMCKFNLSEQELFDTIVSGWAQGQWIEMGERKWNPHQAKLTVLEGPQIPVDLLSIGRGWSNAQHHGEDVTERVLAQARQAASPGGTPSMPRDRADRRSGGSAASRCSDPIPWRCWRPGAWPPSAAPSFSRASRSRWPKRRSPRWMRASADAPPLDCWTPVVGVAQLVELRIVVPAVAGSIPVAHPSEKPC